MNEHAVSPSETPESLAISKACAKKLSGPLMTFSKSSLPKLNSHFLLFATKVSLVSQDFIPSILCLGIKK